MSVGYLSSQQARSNLQKGLGVDAADSILDLRFEYLRGLIYGFSSSGSYPHTTKIVNYALPAWRLLRERAAFSNEEDRSDIQECLSQLADTGDLIDGGWGRWACAITRVVALSGADTNLIVGGLPSVALPKVEGGVRVRGPFRYVGDDETLRRALSVESCEQWARLPKEELLTWAADIGASLVFSPYVPSSEVSLEAYLPERSASGAPQFKRWIQDALPDRGRLLVRRRRLYGTYEYSVAEVRGARVIESCSVPFRDVRRLMYAYDAKSGNRTRARVDRDDSDSLQCSLNSELPRSEQRIFAALGKLQIPLEKPYMRIWNFARGGREALRMLRSLHIEIQRG